MIKEAFKSVFKQRKMSSASIAIMIATMFIFGIFFVLGENINFVMEQVENKQGMRVVIKDDVEETILEGMKSKIQNIEIDGKKVVNTVTFVSKEEAMKSIKERLGDKQDVLEGLDEENFLPASYFVTLNDLSKNQQVQEEIMKFDGVEEISTDNDTIAKLNNIAKGIRMGTLIILVILVVISIAIIAYTVKITVYARRKEIEIMKYVGATNSFVRGPFIIEGLIIGIISAAISVIIMMLVYNGILNSVLESNVIQSLSVSFYTFNELFIRVLGVYLLLGMGIGVLGSSISMKKYLNA
jgi:cell division transport system permease protein